MTEDASAVASRNSVNLVAWLRLVKDREGRVIRQKAIPRKSADLARSLGL